MTHSQDFRLWSLTPKQQDLVNARGAALYLPKWVPADLRVFDTTYKCVTYMHLTRSAAWHYLLGGIYRDGPYQALAALINLLALLLHVNCDIVDTPSPEERLKAMRIVKEKVILALVLFEREFPKTLMVGCLHNLLHMPDQIARWNNLRNFWAFFMERYARKCPILPAFTQQ
jgi:hypothetical protein